MNTKTALTQKTRLTLAEEGADGTLSVGDEIKAEFTFEEFTIFRNFVAKSERLTNSKWIEAGMPSGLDITIDIPTGGLSAESNVPDWDDVIVVLHKFRPFGLNNEPTHFYKVANILNHRIDNQDFRDQIEYAKDQYSGKQSQNELRIEANGVILNSGTTLDNFLNAREYHSDKNKNDFIHSLEQAFPNVQYLEPIFCGLITDRVNAVMYLTTVIQCLLENADLAETEEATVS